MHPQVAAALIGLVGTLFGGLIALRVARATPFLAYRKRSVKGKWIGKAEEIQTLGGQVERMAQYNVTFELRQFRARITGAITALSDGATFTDKLEGRLTTEQDLCFTFTAANENVHDFGAAIFHIHSNGSEMSGYVLSNESSSPGGRVLSCMRK